MRVTREVVEFCHGLGDVTVEGELGTVSGVEEKNPKEAVKELMGRELKAELEH